MVFETLREAIGNFFFKSKSSLKRQIDADTESDKSAAKRARTEFNDVDTTMSGTTRTPVTFSATDPHQLFISATHPTDNDISRQQTTTVSKTTSSSSSQTSTSTFNFFGGTVKDVQVSTESTAHSVMQPTNHQRTRLDDVSAAEAGSSFFERVTCRPALRMPTENSESRSVLRGVSKQSKPTNFAARQKQASCAAWQPGGVDGRRRHYMAAQQFVRMDEKEQFRQLLAQEAKSILHSYFPSTQQSEKFITASGSNASSTNGDCFIIGTEGLYTNNANGDSSSMACSSAASFRRADLFSKRVEATSDLLLEAVSPTLSRKPTDTFLPPLLTSTVAVSRAGRVLGRQNDANTSFMSLRSRVPPEFSFTSGSFSLSHMHHKAELAKSANSSLIGKSRDVEENVPSSNNVAANHQEVETQKQDSSGAKDAVRAKSPRTHGESAHEDDTSAADNTTHNESGSVEKNVDGIKRTPSVETRFPHIAVWKKSLDESKYTKDDFIEEKESLERRAMERRRQLEIQEVTVKSLKDLRLLDDDNLPVRINNTIHTTRRLPVPLEEPLYVEEEEEEEVQEIVDEFPELSEEQENIVNRALKGGSADQTVAEGFKLQICRRDIMTLAGLNWLNDEVINFYMNLLMERGNQDGYPKVYSFNTFFYPKLMSGGHGSVKRWTKQVDLFSYDFILIPVHLGMHWCLAVVDFRRREIRYYDSMGGSNDRCLDALQNYLGRESQEKRRTDFDFSGWKFFAVAEIPQQMNGSDCGMFTCKFAEYIVRNAPITFSQSHMPYFRRRMILEIVQKQLL